MPTARSSPNRLCLHVFGRGPVQRSEKKGTRLRLFCAVTMVLIIGSCSSCVGQLPPWWAAHRSGPFGQQEHSSLTDRTIARDLRLGSPSEVFTNDCLYEMHRMFVARPESPPITSRSIMKSLLALPLLKADNKIAVAVRPQSDILTNHARRAILRSYAKQPRIALPEGTIAVDLHVHTCASPDSLASASDMLISAAKRGLTAVAITDHDTLRGALSAIEVAEALKTQGRLPEGFFVIPGSEITSADGHIVALFLTHDIPAGKSAEWTIQAIHDQGGIAIAAHPLVPNSLADLANTLPFDAVETESGSEKLHYAITPGADQLKRAEFYAKVTRPRVGSSDSHDPEALAQCFTVAGCAATPEALRKAILAGDISPLAAVSDDEEKAIVSRPLLRGLSFYLLLTDLTPLFARYLPSDNITISALPHPAIRFYREF